MNIEEIIKLPEGRRLEFKENLSSGNRIERTAIAFSNDAGGEIYLGIKNDTREITGFLEKEILKLEEQVSNIVFDNSQPGIIPDIAVVNYHGKYILKITVYPGSQTPYFLKSLGKNKGTFIRVGSSNKPADEYILQELERKRRNISFDTLPYYDAAIDELGFTSFAELFTRQTGRKLDKRALDKLGLVRVEGLKRVPTNAALLLSDSTNRSREFHYAKIECARFKGTTTSETIDAQTIDEPICFQPDLAMNFIKRNIKKGSRIGEIYREERWEYPLEAIREVIINAVIHRDYSQMGRDIKVAIYDDMLEITSPGMLPSSIDINNLANGLSEIRNRTLAPIFKQLKLIEQWGTGFLKLKAELMEYPEIEVKYIEPGLSFQVQFIKKEYPNIKTEPRIKSGLSWDQVGTKSGISRDEVEMILESCQYAKPIIELLSLFEWKNRTKFKVKFINPLLELDLITMTIPGKPNSSNQKYMITINGVELLNEIKRIAKANSIKQ